MHEESPMERLEDLITSQPLSELLFSPPKVPVEDAWKSGNSQVIELYYLLLFINVHLILLSLNGSVPQCQQTSPLALNYDSKLKCQTYQITRPIAETRPSVQHISFSLAQFPGFPCVKGFPHLVNHLAILRCQLLSAALFSQQAVMTRSGGLGLNKRKCTICGSPQLLTSTYPCLYIVEMY